MKPNPLRQLKALGQSVWLDYIRRDFLTGGRLAAMIADDGLAGITSNPSIFEDAIARHDFYDDEIQQLLAAGADRDRLYQALTLGDVARAADILRPLWEATGCRDGLVSLEVSPHLADDTEGTVAEAMALWRTLDRPNLMIKVPGTRAGLPAITRLIAAGVNVNVTLLFSVARYRAVADAFVAGLEQRHSLGQSLTGIASVASFFISRIDTQVDAELDRLSASKPEASALQGTAALACARLAYRHYREWTGTTRWQALAAAGAQPQRLLWASTSTKNPAYSDVRYVEELIAPETVNTLPPATLEAYRDHGDPALRLEPGIAEAAQGIAHLAAVGIDMDRVAEQLEREGVDKFIAAHDALLAVLATRCGG
ncbi:MAG: transaldolase [Porticoccaceae bacterium]